MIRVIVVGRHLSVHTAVIEGILETRRKIVGLIVGDENVGRVSWSDKEGVGSLIGVAVFRKAEVVD